MNNFRFALCAFCAFFSVFTLRAQYDPTAHISRLALETRLEFDYFNQNSVYKWHNPDATYSILDTNTYGFNGKYLNFILAGDFGKHFSYFYRQRIIANPGKSSFFDNTDFLYLTYHINDRFALTFGKQALNIGSYEYDAAPIDVYFYTQFWSTIACFQLGVNFSYTDKEKKNIVSLQMTNSPYIYLESAWQNRFFGKGIFAYSLSWYGNFNHFHTMYSINMLERERGKFIAYLCLGHKLDYDRWSIYVDYMNRAASTKKCFSDFSIISRVDVKLGKGVSIYAKGGYEQNFAEEFATGNVLDIMVVPGHQYGFGGVGLEYRPVKYSDIRFHTYVVYKADMSRIWGVENTDVRYDGLWNANIGVTWNIDFLRYIHKIRDKRLAKSLENNN